MQPDRTETAPSESDKKHAAKAEFRRAIKTALAAGLSWRDIVKLMAEVGPGKLP